MLTRTFSSRRSGNMLFFRREVIEEILALYLNGAAVWEICDYMGMGSDEVNRVIDQYSPYL